MGHYRAKPNPLTPAVLLFSLSLVGCSHAKPPSQNLSEKLRLQGSARGNKATTTAPADARACELWMTFVVPKKAKHLALQAATLKEYLETYAEPNQWTLSEPACIKSKETPDFLLPNQITLRGETGGLDADLCVSEKYTTTGTIASCIWNGAYLDREPFDIIFSSYAPNSDVPQDAPLLSKLLHGIQVYRNGDLVYRWRGAAAQPSLTSLVIRGAELRQKLMPYDAPLELRLLPHTAEVPGDYFDEVVKTQGDFRREELDRIQKALGAALPEKLTEHFKEFNNKFKKLGECARTLTDPLYAPTSASATTNPWATQWKNFKKEGSGNFKKDAVQLEEALTESLNKLHVEASEAVAQLKTEATGWNSEMEHAHTNKLKLFNDRLLGESWPSYRTRKLREPGTEKKVKDALNQVQEKSLDWFWFELRFAGDVVQELLRRGEAAIQQTLAVADAARSLVKDIREYGRDLKSPERQAEAFKQIAESLAERSVFEQYYENPPTAPGELNLPMRYRDPLQVYFLHVWHGIALKVRTPPGLSTTEINAANLVPFIDAVGGRYQWGKSRFAEFRLALAIGFISDEIFVNNQHDIEKRSLFVGNINVSLATFQVGFGAILPFECEVWRRQKHADFFRVFLGVDLVHLLSGQPFMGFNIPQSND